MSGNTFGLLFTVTSFGESHGPAIGCVVDGCPPGMALDAAWIQAELDRRKPGTSRHVTQRREPDEVEILSGVFEGKTTGTPIALLIRNTDQRSKDYGNIADTFDHRYIFPVAALVGFVVLSAAYFIMNFIFYGSGVVSIIIELVGGTVFLIVILKKGRL